MERKRGSVEKAKNLAVQGQVEVTKDTEVPQVSMKKTNRPWGQALAIFLLFPVLVFTGARKSCASKTLTEAFNMAQTATQKMGIKSPSFAAGGPIPAQFSCKGSDTNPPLVFENVPAGTKSLVLIVDDPDAPGGTWVHWVMWNIQPDAGRIEADSAPRGAVQGINSWGKTGYGGPCPPSGTHHYHFKLYALDTKLSLDSSSGKPELEAAMQGHILAHSEVIGLFSK